MMNPEPGWFDIKGRLRIQMERMKERLMSHPLFNEFSGEKSDTSEQLSTLQPPSLIHSLEIHLIHLQSILVWDNPSKSFFSLGCFTLGYWFLVAWTRSIFSLICSFIFIIKLYSLWTHYVWPEIRVPPTEDQLERENWIPVHPQAFSAPEIKRIMDQAVEISSSFITCLLNLRRVNRGLFCLVMSTSFLMIGFLGSTISGSLFVYLSLMTCALAPGLVLHVLPSGFVPMIKSFFPVNPYDDGTDVFAEDIDPKAKVSTSKVPLSQSSPDDHKVPSSTFPLPMLFDLISNPSSDDSNQTEVTFLQRQIAGIQSEATSSNLTEVSTVESSDLAEESFIRRAISSAISFRTSRSSSGDNHSPKDGDRSPGSNSSGRSSNGIKIVASHYESSGAGTPSESDDNLLDEGYEIVTDNEINQLNR